MHRLDCPGALDINSGTVAGILDGDLEIDQGIGAQQIPLKEPQLARLALRSWASHLFLISFYDEGFANSKNS